MGKDKKNKGTKADASATQSAFAKPSEAPNTGGGDGWSLEDKAGTNLGKLILFTPMREDDHVDKFDKNGGTKQHIVADVVVLNEKKPEKSEVHEDVWIFGGYVRGSLRGYIGDRKVLGRLQRDIGDKKFKSSNEPWYIEDATPEEEAIAMAYLETVDPFAQSSGEKKKAKKGKK